MSIRKSLLCGCAALLAIGSFGTAHAIEPVPLGDFFREAAVTSAVASPSGRYVALTEPGQSNGRLRLVVVDLRDLDKSRVAAAVDGDITSVYWVNEDRLVFSAEDRRLPGVQDRVQGEYTVAREGTLDAQRLVGGSRYSFGQIFALPRDGSNDVIIQRYSYDNAIQLLGSVLLRYDVTSRSGTSRSLSLGAPDHVYQWALDAQSVPRAAVSEFQGKSRLYLKPDAAGPWKMVREYDNTDDKGEAIEPLRVLTDGKLYAVGRSPKNADTTSLLRIDMSHPEQPPQVLMALDGYDFSGSMIVGADGQLLGIRYLTDASATYWFDARLKKIQADLDAAMPGMVNSIQCGQCANLDNVLVASWSDRQPAIYRIFDSKAMTLSKGIESRPWIDPKTMATRDMEKFTARDGLPIPVYVTRPPNTKGPAPMVVLVHGGPFLRVGEWEWDRESQFLASRGYVVVEPEFRGTAGFGSRLFRAGWKQWGLAMQDDIADAARWAVKQGYADPKRICIAGASYGGYATLMGLVRDADLYRCGVEWAGVTDIDLMYSITWSDTSEEGKQYSMPLMIGDPVKDAKQLADTSPVKQAAHITRPLLMAHGGQDRRVPIQQGTIFRDAVREHNPNTEWVEYALEGHGWALEATNLDFWARVERFLDKSLKNAP